MGTIILANVDELETIKISELTQIDAAGTNDVLPIVSTGVTRKISKADFTNLTNIIYVAKNGSDDNTGTIGDPFLSIGAANDYVLANLPAWPIKTIISVAPGIYTEHITSSFYRIYIIGQGYTDSEKDNPVVIRNTGADPDHYPLACTTTGLNLKGIHVVTTDEDNLAVEGAYGPLHQSSTFVSCKFGNGYFVNASNSVGSIYQYMKNCHFYNGEAFRISGTTDSYRSINLVDCTIAHTTDMLFDAVCTTNTNGLKLDDCFIASKINVKGNWNANVLWSEMDGDDAKITFDTDGWVNLYSTVIVGGIHFYTDTPLTKKCVNCLFQDTPTGEGDITADEAIEFIEYSGNHQHNGIDGEVITVSKIKNVGGGQNMYRNIHEALKGSLLTDTIINMEGDVEITEPLVINPDIDIQIDGNKKWKLTTTHATTLVEITANQSLSFVNLKQILGGKKAILNGNSASLSFVSCGRYTEPNHIDIEMNGGDIASFVYITESTMISTLAAVVTINDIDPWLIIDKSFLQGIIGQPAIEWTVDADSRFRVKYSTLIHGSGGGNSPLVGNSLHDVTISMYNCSMNASFPPADFTNTINNANNTVDSSIDY